MKVLGLVTEYNPFHNGHLYHLRESKRVTGATHTVAVMSGHFLQRGEPAIADKWTRAAMAVASGVDLVIELPAVYACASADHFARGSVLLLEQLGCVTDLCFGSENGQLDAIDRISDILAYPTREYEQELRRGLDKGVSFSAAQQSALIKTLNKTVDGQLNVLSVFNQPNNILGIAYLTQLKLNQCRMKAHTIRRIGAGYHDEHLHHQISSATGIRHQIRQSNDLSGIRHCVPEAAFDLLCKGFSMQGGPVFMSDFEDAVMILLKRTNEKELTKLPYVTEGLENRMMNCIRKSSTLDAFFSCVKNKRIPYTRLQRIVIHLLLGIDNSLAVPWYTQQKPPYARILAFNDTGRALIKHCRTTAQIPLISKTATFQPDSLHVQELLMLDYRASRIYGTALKSHQFRQGEPDLLISPIYLR